MSFPEATSQLYTKIKLTARALLLINMELGSERKVLEKLHSIQNIKEAHLTYGVYDIIIILEAETQKKIKETITYQIRALLDIKSTLTMVVVG
jgi:DNA-binding Lrp family transcriptional regulator